jgi:periplasmic protein TonB
LAAVHPDHARATEAAMQKRLIKRVDPQLPLGDASNIRGEVVFKAVISKDGNIKSLWAVSGHPMLIPPAIAAVKQWRYKPLLFNRYPLEVETTIRVGFPGKGASAP